MSKQPQIPHRPIIARSCPSSSIAHDRRGRRRNRFLKCFSVAAVLFTSGHALYAQGAANALFIDENGNLTIGTTTFIYQSGNVGIGTLEPKSSLSVAGGGVAVGNSYAKSNPASANDLLVEGNVGIGVIGMPMDKLEVAGNLRILTNGGNPIRFTSKWSGFPDSNSNQAEIANDTDYFKTLMIIGNN